MAKTPQQMQQKQQPDVDKVEQQPDVDVDTVTRAEFDGFKEGIDAALHELKAEILATIEHLRGDTAPPSSDLEARVKSLENKLRHM